MDMVSQSLGNRDNVTGAREKIKGKRNGSLEYHTTLPFSRERRNNKRTNRHYDDRSLFRCGTFSLLLCCVWEFVGRRRDIIVRCPRHVYIPIIQGNDPALEKNV
jgi:hypothetical protein